MRKRFLVLAAATMVMASCSNTDVLEEGVDQQTRKIGFESLVNKGTRGLDNTEDLTKFKVFGSYTPQNESKRIVNFNDVDVTNTSGAWEYASPRYWLAGATYHFFAYSNENEALSTGVGFNSGTGILNIRNYQADETHQKDLVFARSGAITGKEKDNAEVGFAFKHALARLMVTFKSGFPAGYKIKISKLKIEGMYGTGDYIQDVLGDATSHWEIADNAPSTHVNPAITVGSDVATAAVGETPAVNVTSGYAYVIPHDYVGNSIVSIAFTIDVTYEGVAILSQNLKANWAPKWEENHSYNYNVTINGTAAGLEPIKFTVSAVDGWEEGTPTLGDMDLSVDYSTDNN